jgi:hypothetical protein
MSDGDTSCALKGLNSILALLRSLSPGRPDEDMPDLEVSLWRFSDDDYEIAVGSRGECTPTQVYCRVRIWVRLDRGRREPLDHERWLRTSKNAVCTRFSPQRLAIALRTSAIPIPGPAALPDPRWMGLVSPRSNVVAGLGTFRGRLCSSSPRPDVYSRLRFVWTHCRGALLLTTLWFLVCAGVCAVSVHWLWGLAVRAGIAP